jgi:hypothetical protein
MLKCQLHIKNSFREDHFISGTKDTMESLLTEGAGGGLYILMLNPIRS